MLISLRDDQCQMITRPKQLPNFILSRPSFYFANGATRATSWFRVFSQWRPSLRNERRKQINGAPTQNETISLRHSVCKLKAGIVLSQRNVLF